MADRQSRRSREAPRRMREPDPVLRIQDLHVYYGHSHALQGVNLTLEHSILSVVGRNGMGKTTLCKAVMGLVEASSGSIRYESDELNGLHPHEIARLGVGYVPQGRRLWPTLTVDEHLRLCARGGKSAIWTVDRIYQTFPRLAERRNNGGGQLSGGEQQMLANPQLLIMDEPTEGLAPVIVAQVEEMLHTLREETDIAVLVIEQNIGVATAISENVAIMVNGRINRIMDSMQLANDRDLQQRLPHTQPCTDKTGAREHGRSKVNHGPGPAHEYSSDCSAERTPQLGIVNSPTIFYRTPVEGKVKESTEVMARARAPLYRTGPHISKFGADAGSKPQSCRESFLIHRETG